MHVRNWKKYQHYKNRNPPWVRLYYETLTSRWWIKLDDKHRSLAITCIVIASRHDGEVPNDIDYVCQVGHIKSKPTFDMLFECDFLTIDVSEELPGSRSEEGEKTEAYADRARASKMLAPNASKPLADKEFTIFWKTYPRKIGKRAAEKAFILARRTNDWPGLDAVIEAIEHAKESKQWSENNGQFIPHPTTWLNRGGWDDEQTREGSGYLELIAEFEGEATNGES